MAEKNQTQDREGSRHHDKFRFKFTSAGDSETFECNHHLRKFSVRNGDGHVELKIHAKDGNRVFNLRDPHQKERYTHEFNKSDAKVTVTCLKMHRGDVGVYLHLEWDEHA